MRAYRQFLIGEADLKTCVNDLSDEALLVLVVIPQLIERVRAAEGRDLSLRERAILEIAAAGGGR